MAAVIVGAMLAANLGCIGWQRLHDARLTARILAGGFVPWAGGEGGADHLYWLHQPGRLLHIVGTIGDRTAIAFVLLGLTAFLATLAWTLRGTMAPPCLLPVSLGAGVLFTGAFFSRPGYPTDFTLDRDRGAYLDHGAPLAALCDVVAIGIHRSSGGRGGSFYTLVGRRRDGASVDLQTFAAPGPAIALQGQVAADAARLECPAVP